MKTEFEIIDGITWADVAFRAYGNDLSELFFSSASAVISIMLDNPESINSSIERVIKLKHLDVELLLFEFLQEFIFFKDSELLLLKPESVTVEEVDNEYKLQCNASGEHIDREKHLFTVDIKAVTMHKFAIEYNDGKWSATVVLDV